MNNRSLIIGFVCLVSLQGCSKLEPTTGEKELLGSPASRGAMMAAYQGTTNAMDGVVIVKFKRGSEPGVISMSGDGLARTGVGEVDRVGGQVGAYRVERVFPYAAKFEKKRRGHGLDLWYRVWYDSSKSSLSQAAAAYSQIEQLDWVETARRGVLIGDQGGFQAVESASSMSSGGVSPALGAQAERPFNDPMLKDQWWIDAKTTATEGVHPQADINLFAAWNRVRGSREVIVCVVDGCVKWDHADLAANMWANPGEIPGNFIDDDENGCLDDVWGFDFSQKNETIHYVPHDHGTHVAGIVAAVNNNGIGVCGVAGGSGYGDGARIMSCQIFNQTMSTYDQMAQAIEYGANMGAVISQNSWGFQDPEDRSEVIRQAIEYFVAEAGDPELFPNSPMRGGLVFFAAGNLGDKLGQQKLYPQAYDGAIAVASTDHQRKRSGFSCYGDWVEISAPGGSGGNDEEHFIKSTFAGKSSNYGYFPGTSQACPMVSGVAALLIQANPGKTNEQIKELLLSSVSSLQDTEPEFAVMGSGILNAAKHLGSSNDNVGPAPVADLTLVNDPTNNSLALQWTVPQDPARDFIDTYYLYFSESQITQQNLASVTKVTLSEYKAKPSGEKITLSVLDIKGFDPLKECYLALTSSDQWGNLSQLSNVLQYVNRNDEKGPSKITDLTLLENPSTRAMSLQWSVPKEQIGDWVKSYCVYHSNHSLNAANLSGASQTTLDQFVDLAEGEKITIKLDKIKGFNVQQSSFLTITSTDRWGNTSQISNIAAHTTASEVTTSSLFTGGELIFSLGRDHLNTPKRLIIYDRSARIVVQKNFPATPTQNTLTVNVSTLASGNYTYSFESDGAQVLGGTFRKV